MEHVIIEKEKSVGEENMEYVIMDKAQVQPFTRVVAGKVQKYGQFFRTGKDSYPATDQGVNSFLGDYVGISNYGHIIANETKSEQNLDVAATNAYMSTLNYIVDKGQGGVLKGLSTKDNKGFKRLLKHLYDRVYSDVRDYRMEMGKSVDGMPLSSVRALAVSQAMRLIKAGSSEAAHKAWLRRQRAEQKAREGIKFNVGDSVVLREDVLQRHARSVPAHAGYTHEQFHWRDTLRKLEGQTGQIERTFENSKHVNVQFRDGTLIGIDRTELDPAIKKPAFGVMQAPVAHLEKGDMSDAAKKAWLKRHGGKFREGPSGDYNIKTHRQAEYEQYLESLKDDEKDIEKEKKKLSYVIAPELEYDRARDHIVRESGKVTKSGTSIGAKKAWAQMQHQIAHIARVHEKVRAKEHKQELRDRKKRNKESWKQLKNWPY